MHNMKAKNIADKFIKPWMILSVLYLFSISSLLRADMLYRDDLERAADGVRIWYKGSRYVNEVLSVFLHAGRRIFDSSPLPQVLAAVIIAGAAMMILWIFSEGKQIGYLQMLFSAPLLLFPYYPKSSVIHT